MSITNRAHDHYFKDVSRLSEIDVYRVLELFGVTSPSIGHAVKKLLVAGGRGGGKDVGRDIQEAIDTLKRWQQMREEDLREPSANPKVLVTGPGLSPEYVIRPAGVPLGHLNAACAIKP